MAGSPERACVPLEVEPVSLCRDRGRPTHDRRMMPRGVPDDLDTETGQRVLRSFLLVRIVRGTLLLLFLALALLGVEVRGWPAGVAIAIAVALLVQAAALAVWLRRWARRTARVR